MSRPPLPPPASLLPAEHDPGTWRTLRHDLRTPINHILGYSEMLLEEPETIGSPEALERMREIWTAGRNALAAVDQVFELSDLRGGAPDGSLLDAGLRSPVEIILERCQRLEADAGRRQQTSLSSDLTKIAEAAQRLRDLGRSLLDAPASPAAPPPEAAPSPPRAAPEEPGPAAAAVPAPTGHATVRRGAILVVDDDRNNRELLSRKLERLGHWVLLAENGKQALDLVRQVSLDLVLLDLVMPEMDGYQSLEILKSDEELRHLPVIVLSSLNELAGMVRCIDMGAEDFLPKPVDDVLLRARIGATLEKKRLRDQEIFHLQQIEHERARANMLLHAIFPDEIAQELKAVNRVEPRRHDNVAVLFTDIVGFTPYCETLPPQDVVAQLQALTEAYEDIVVRHEIQKIKTVGDAFMAAAGLLRPVESPVLSCIRCGVEMIAAASRLPPHWSVRVGIHVGPVVAGVLGRRQYLFDLWGDTVNTAARVQSHGSPNSITLSRAACDQVAGRCRWESLGMLDVKGKGGMEIFRFLDFTDKGGP